MIRDQIIIGTCNEDIRCNALKNQWELQELVAIFEVQGGDLNFLGGI